ncbi:MAG TPA: SIS domain-containing protein [Acidimicrobiales bacterium]
MSLDAHSFAHGEITKLRQALDRLDRDPYPGLLSDVSGAVLKSLEGGGKVMFCGNGGSAADAQHLAAELVGRQNFDRPAAAGLALTVDTSALTAVGNDYGYQEVFSRQVEGVGRPNDVLFAISTSGRSPNVVRALAAAKAAGITTVALTGRDSREMACADHVVAVPAGETPKIQELHIVCGHIIFALVEQARFGSA